MIVVGVLYRSQQNFRWRLSPPKSSLRCSTALTCDAPHVHHDLSQLAAHVLKQMELRALATHCPVNHTVPESSLDPQQLVGGRRTSPHAVRATLTHGGFPALRDSKCGFT